MAPCAKLHLQCFRGEDKLRGTANNPQLPANLLHALNLRAGISSRKPFLTFRAESGVPFLVTETCYSPIYPYTRMLSHWNDSLCLHLHVSFLYMTGLSFSTNNKTELSWYTYEDWLWWIFKILIKPIFYLTGTHYVPNIILDPLNKLPLPFFVTILWSRIAIYLIIYVIILLNNYFSFIYYNLLNELFT